MRNLTVIRQKTFVASLVKMKVYIEDPTSPEITIQGTPCRKLCDLKNGEEKTVPISEDAARVYVIADALSKNYCNEFYEIPAGEEDIFLSGKNHFNPGAGNPFRFDGNTSETAMQNRKKNGKKGMVILLVAIAVGIVVGFFAGQALVSAILGPKTSTDPQTFSAEGMEITLTGEFREVEFGDFTACYESPNIAIFALKEPFTLVEGMENYTLEEYGKLVLQSNGMEESALQKLGENYCFDFTYTDSETGEVIYYLSVVYRANDAFWLIQFAILEEELAEYEESMIAWANSVTFP